VTAVSWGCEEEDTAEARRIYTVSYSLNVTGESSVESLSYQGGGQEITIENPEDGWSKQFPGGNGQTISASAVGTAKNGRIVIYMRADIDNRTPVEEQAECEESEGIPKVCSLSTPEVSLE
jgi:hypothetical protein